jgi:hypothetical protein
MDEFFDQFSDNLYGKKVDVREITFNFITKTVCKTLFGVERKFTEENIDSMRHNTEKYEIFIFDDFKIK